MPLTLGNYVKVDTSQCLLEGCSQGHTPHHWSFHERVGKLVANGRDTYTDHIKHDPSLRTMPIICSICKEVRCTLEEILFQKEHYWDVCFDGEHSRFAPWELRDMGSDLSKTVEEATREPVLIEAIGEPLLAGAAS